MTRPRSIPSRLESDRLILRVPTEADALALNRAVRASLAQLRPWMPWAQTAPTLAASRKRCREAAKNFREGTDLMLLLFPKDGGELIGAIGLTRIDWSVPRLEIGYWIATRHAGYGYATEATRVVADFAFKKLKAARVEIHCDHRNKGSRRVAERAGFPVEATLRHHRRDVRGRLTDMCIYARTASRK